MIRKTGSSNYGHAICCKPDYFGGDCNNDGPLTCSQPSFALETSSDYMNVLTNGVFNYQMFAFVPKINPYMCGIKSTRSPFKPDQMKIFASNFQQ